MSNSTTDFSSESQSLSWEYGFHLVWISLIGIRLLLRNMLQLYRSLRVARGTSILDGMCTYRCMRGRC